MASIPQTPNFKLYKPAFDRRAWHQYINENFSIIDAVLTTYLDVSNIVGVWENSTAYTVGQRVIDPDVGQVFEVNANHTSAAGPTTFEEDRAANPTYWTSLAVTARGLDAWVSGTVYQPNDFVVSGTIYAVCIATHTSGAVFANDAVYWDYLIDISSLPTLPSVTGKSLQLLRVDVGETGTEWVSDTDVKSWLALGTAAFTAATDYALASHTHTVAQISDASADGRSLISAANYAAMRTALGVPALASGNTFTASQNIIVAGVADLRLVSTDAGATGGRFIIHHDSASPAINDIIGQIFFQGEDSAGNETSYGSIRTRIVDPTNGSEDGVIEILTPIAGSSAIRFAFGHGLYGTGLTDQGANSVNAASFYKSNNLTFQTLQRLHQNSSTPVADAANIIPTDNTTPLVTEGAEAFSQVVTPKSASSTIRLSGVLSLGGSGASINTVVTLFRDNTCIATFPADNVSTAMDQVAFEFEEVSGSVAARTYSVRYGSGVGTVGLNDNSAATSNYGSTATSTFTVEEYLQ